MRYILRGPLRPCVPQVILLVSYFLQVIPRNTFSPQNQMHDRKEYCPLLIFLDVSPVFLDPLKKPYTNLLRLEGAVRPNAPTLSAVRLASLADLARLHSGSLLNDRSIVTEQLLHILVHTESFISGPLFPVGICLEPWKIKGVLHIVSNLIV